jgi:hypothetical protein
MGRPLNKKYFGNRNVGSGSTTADDGIGGEGVASISLATQGSFVVNNTYQNFPYLSIGAPNIPTGVQATVDVVFELNTVSGTTGNGSGYTTGLSTSITGLGGGAIVHLTVNGSGAVTGVDLTTSGAYRGDFRRGDFTGNNITSFQVVQGTANTLQITCTFRVKSITVTEKGSGYISLPALAWQGHNFTGQTVPSGNTPALTTDNTVNGNQYASESGDANVVGYQDKAIIAVDIATSEIVDIIKQENTHRYKVRTSSGTKFLNLADPTSASTGLYIQATDSSNYSYWVSKLNGHKATVEQLSNSGPNFRFASNTAVPWTFSNPDATNVKIRNG